MSLKHSYYSMDEPNFLLNQCLFMQAWWKTLSHYSVSPLLGPCQCPLKDPEERRCWPASHGMTAGLPHHCHAGSLTPVFDAVGNMPEDFVPQLMCLLEILVGGGGWTKNKTEQCLYVALGGIAVYSHDKIKKIIPSNAGNTAINCACATHRVPAVFYRSF